MRLVFLLVSILSISTLSAQSVDTTKIYTSDSSQADLFEMVDVKPSIDGKAWTKHLTKFLQSVIENAAEKRMKDGVYVVKLRCIIKEDGSISDVQAMNDPGYGLAKGAEDAMRASPKWNPGEKNGEKVRSYYVQPITFVIQTM